MDGKGKIFSFSCAPHDIPQIFYSVSLTELFHRKSQLFAVERFSVFFAVALAQICGEFSVNFTRCCIIYLRDVVNSQLVVLFILVFVLKRKEKEFKCGLLKSILEQAQKNSFKAIQVDSETSRLF